MLNKTRENFKQYIRIGELILTDQIFRNDYAPIVDIYLDATFNTVYQVGRNTDVYRVAKFGVNGNKYGEWFNMVSEHFNMVNP